VTYGTWYRTSVSAPKLLWTALLALVLSPQDPAAVRDAGELYPPARPTEVVRFLLVATDQPDVGEMTAALKQHGARIVYGPRTTSGRPGRSFFGVQAPRELKVKELERAARKAGGAADELAVVAFEGREDRDTQVGAGLGLSSRDFVLGMSGEIAWFDSVGGWSQFYGLPGKLTSEELADRYFKLYQPFGGGRLGRLVRERFAWPLCEAPDEKRGAKLLKAVRKLDGVADAALEGAVLTLVVALEDLTACGVAGTVPAGADAQSELDTAGLAAPRAAFDTGPLWDLLAAEGLAPRGEGDQR